MPTLVSRALAVRAPSARPVLALLVAVIGNASVVAAQAPGGTIGGVVVRSASLTPIEAAQVSVEGTTLGASTDQAGRFRISGLSGDRVTLRVRRVGFQPLTETASVGASDLRLVLIEAPVSLEQVVVTGTAAGEQRRSLGNSVATISASAAQAIAPATDLGKMLNSRAAGVTIIGGSGRIGAGPAINIRGRSTLSLSNQPLIYIDGVRVVNDIATGPRTQGGPISSRLNDINPEDVESIEIIKGPAAGTIYGTEASNGVIQIITKKGRGGEHAQWNMAVRQGTQWFNDPAGRIGSNYGLDATGKIIEWNPVKQEEARGTPIWKNGRIQNYRCR